MTEEEALVRERAENNRLRLVISRLTAEVTAWMCLKCRHVYPGPPQAGAWCVVCPRCGGDTMPRNAAEVHELRAEIKQLRAENAMYQRALREIIADDPDSPAHNCDAMGCGSLSHVLYSFGKGAPQ